MLRMFEFTVQYECETLCITMKTVESVAECENVDFERSCFQNTMALVEG